MACQPLSGDSQPPENRKPGSWTFFSAEELDEHTDTTGSSSWFPARCLNLIKLAAADLLG